MSDILFRRFKPSAGEKLDLLVFVPYPSIPDIEAGQLLTARENDFILDFLEGKEDWGWGVQAVFPARLSDKPKKADYNEVEKDVIDAIVNHAPSVVMSMGEHALKILWPKAKGKVPSINKVRTLPVDLGNGRKLVCTYAPSRHHLWLRTDGRRGLDCTSEFVRAFSLASDIVDGTYTQPSIQRWNVKSMEAVDELEKKMLTLGIRDLSIDIEDRTFIVKGGKAKPHTWAVSHPNYKMPECLTMWHPDNQMDEFGLTFDYLNERGERVYETYTLWPEVQTKEVFHRLLSHKCLDAWNRSYEEQAMWRYHGIDLLDIPGVTIEDPMIYLCAADQSIPGLGLKENAQTKENLPAWDFEILLELERAKSAREVEGGPKVASFGDCDAAIRREYNGWDTYSLRRLVRNYFDTDRFVGLKDDCLTYSFLVERALPFFNDLEREGICVDLDHVNAMLDKYEDLAAGILKWVEEQPEIGKALEGVLEYYAGKGQKLNPGTKNYDTKMRYNPRSPVFIPELIKVTHGGEVPKWYPKTDKGQWSRKNENFAHLAGDTIFNKKYKVLTPVEEKSRAQVFWFMVCQHKQALEAASQFYTILNYTCADSRIHANFRLIKTDTEDADEVAGGAKSGRTSSNPNVQNDKDDVEIKDSFVAPPGYVIAELDFGRAELVVLAYNTGDELFRQWAIEGKDQHLEKGATLWGIANNCSPDFFWKIRSRAQIELLDEVHPEQKPWRDSGKTQNFADVYLQEPKTVAAMYGIPIEECIEAAYLSQQAHPAVYNAKKKLYEQCQNGEMIRTSILGRCRSPYGWRYSEQPVEEFLSFEKEHTKDRNNDNMSIFRSLWNTKIGQADANDITMWKGCDIREKLKAGGWLNPDWVRCHNFIHDSLWFYIKEDYVDTAVPALVSEMSNLTTVPCKGVVGGFDLPLKVSVKVGHTKASLATYKSK